MATPMAGVKLSKQERRRLKKENKAKFTLFRHEQIDATDMPTCHLVVGNGGLGNNIQYEQLYCLFSPHGHLVDIQMIPRKPYAFVSYETPEEGQRAFAAAHGEVIQNGSSGNSSETKLYLAFVENVPKPSGSSAKLWPQGLHILHDFASEEQEKTLLACVDWEQEDQHLTEGGKQVLKHRRVKHYGYEFRYDINNVDQKQPLQFGIPAQCNDVIEAIMKTGHVLHRPDQLTVNEYQPGQGIPPHIDTHSAFEDEIISLGLGSQTVMDFRHPDGHHLPVLIPRKALVIMTGESRYLWSHGITPRKSDIIPASQDTPGLNCKGQSQAPEAQSSPRTLTLLNRGTRTSFTFRTLRQGECHCDFPKQCDSQKDARKTKAATGTPSLPQSSTQAAILENVHVHQVYDEIADHFSATRHTGWPQVVDFLRSLPKDSLVADIGCGNGKYMINQPHLFMIGSDRSVKLCEICIERHLEVIACDILAIPFRKGVFDAAICIAVIHHLSTSERRLAGIQEALKVLSPGGRALIYVWALEQERQSVKSNYLSDCRIKHREALTETPESGASSYRQTKPSGETSRDEGGDGLDTFHHKETSLEVASIAKTSGNSVAPGSSLHYSSGADLRNFKDACNKNISETAEVVHTVEKLTVHVNRTHFESKDLLVPWHLRDKQQAVKQKKEDSGEPVFHRYYHVFEESELEELVLKAGGVKVVKSYHDKGNWCVILQKY